MTETITKEKTDIIVKTYSGRDVMQFETEGRAKAWLEKGPQRIVKIYRRKTVETLELIQ